MVCSLVPSLIVLYMVFDTKKKKIRCLRYNASFLSIFFHACTRVRPLYN